MTVDMRSRFYGETFDWVLKRLRGTKYPGMKVCFVDAEYSRAFPRPAKIVGPHPDNTFSLIEGEMTVSELIDILCPHEDDDRLIYLRGPDDDYGSYYIGDDFRESVEDNCLIIYCWEEGPLHPSEWEE